MDRRPLKSRGSWWSESLLSRLLTTSITPDQISLASMLFALIAGLSFSLQALYPPLFLVVAAVGIQLRLLCNLLDGMLAVEGGRGSRYGVLFNELPDRVADVLIIVGAGVGYRHAELCGVSVLHVAWLSAVLAVGTAYLRVFGASIGAGHCFFGPMAKPHRMALLTGIALFDGAVSAAKVWDSLMPWGLLLMCIGLILTLFRRLSFIQAHISERL